MLINFLNKPSGTKEKKVNLSGDVKPISEVSESAITDMQAVKNYSEHFEFEDIIPYCPNLSAVSGLYYTYSKNYKNITNEKEMLDQQKIFMEKVFSKSISDFNINCFEIVNYWSIDKKENYSNVEEFLKDDKENSKREPSDFGFIDQDEKHLIQFYIPSSFNNLSMAKGKCYELCYKNRMNEKDGLTTLTQPRFVCEKVADYYVHENNSRLDDKWNLADGEISVKDGINFAEKYIDDLARLDGENEDVKLKIAYVEVYKVEENLYCFRYKIRRDIGGVLCSSLDNGASIGNVNLDYDIADAYQIEKKEIDMYDGPTKILKCKKENESKLILPLDKAIELLEKNVGNNSKYLVKAIELGYLSLVDDANKQDEGHATVCWYFKCINEQDNMITEFYINAMTGEINTYARHK